MGVEELWEYKEEEVYECLEGGNEINNFGE